MVVGFLPRAHSGPTPTSPPTSGGSRRAAAASPAARGPALRGGLDMFARQAAYLPTVHERGTGSDGYEEHADAFLEVRQALAVRRRGRPCRATTTCSPATSSTTARRCWLIDYEYSGNNDACFELGNTATECDLDDDQVEACARRTSGRQPAPTWRGCGCRRCLAVRLVALGSDPGGRQPPRLRLLRLGAGAVREGRGDLPRRRTSSGCWRRSTRGLTLPSRARVVVVGGGVIGASVAYHLAGLGWTTCCCWSRAPSPAVRRGTRPGWSARCARRRAAPGWCSTPPSSTRARGGDRPGDRLPHVGGVIVARTEDRMVQLRRTAANAAAYDLECALLTPSEALSVAADAGRRPARRDLAARRRQGQPHRPDDGAGQGRPAAAAPGRRAGAGHRLDVATGGGALGCAPTGEATSRPRWS